MMKKLLLLVVMVLGGQANAQNADGLNKYCSKLKTQMNRSQALVTKAETLNGHFEKIYSKIDKAKENRVTAISVGGAGVIVTGIGGFAQFFEASEVAIINVSKLFKATLTGGELGAPAQSSMALRGITTTGLVLVAVGVGMYAFDEFQIHTLSRKISKEYIEAKDTLRSINLEYSLYCK